MKSQRLPIPRPLLKRGQFLDWANKTTLSLLALSLHSSIVYGIMVTKPAKRPAVVVFVEGTSMTLEVHDEDELLNDAPKSLAFPNRDEGDGSMLVVFTDRKGHNHIHTFDPVPYRQSWQAKFDKQGQPLSGSR